MTEDDRAEVGERIAETRKAYQQAEKEGRFDPVAPYVADDLVVMMPGHPPIEGKSEWESLFNQTMADAPEKEYEITYSSSETLVNGSLAIDRGTAIDSTKTEETGMEQGGYSYVWVYQREPDDEWKLSRLIWNSTG